MQLSKLGLGGEKEAQLKRYTELLLEYNAQMNLTSITKEPEINLKHYWDSLSVFRAGCLSETGLSLLDIGAGAGFPGVPMAIARPDLKITLLDSQQKRINFLKLVCEDLGLKNTVCICAKGRIHAPGSRGTLTTLMGAPST